MFLKKTAALAALCIGFAAPVQALTTVNLIGTVVDLPFPGTVGPLAGTVGTGTLTYDETLLTGLGLEALGPAGTFGALEDPSLALSFTIFGQTFTHDNDPDFPDFPLVEFLDGNLDFINFGLAHGLNGVDLSSVGLLAAGFVPLPPPLPLLQYDAGEDAYLVDVGVLYAPVPLPAGLPLLVAGLGAFALVRRKTSK